MKKIYGVALAMALLVAVAVWLFASNITKESEKSKEPEIPTKVVTVAAANIVSGTTITPEMLKVVKIPQTAVLAGTYEKTEELIGCVTVENIYAQEQITNIKVRAKDDLVPTHLSYSIEEGQRAVTISVSSVTGVGYYIKKGDKIDILYTSIERRKNNAAAVPPAEGAPANNGDDKGVTTRMLLQNCPVAATGTYADNRQEGELASYDTITLCLPVEDAMTLVSYYNSNGENKVITLLLRNRDDETTTEFVVEDVK